MHPRAALLSPFFSLSLVLAACGAPPSAPATLAAAGASVTVQYSASAEVFANPERGLFVQRYGVLPAHPDWVGLDAADLRRQREQAGISLVRLIYSLRDYRGRDLDAAVLGRIDQDAQTLRQAGDKAVLRFAYAYFDTPAQDTSLYWVKRHIAQLAPKLRANADVIAYLEAGFVGDYGEWHDSSNRLVEPGNWAVNSSSRQILDALLDALPKERMVALRYPRQKQQYLGPDPIGSAQAFNQSSLARLGHHDDCFGAGSTNWGTYDGGDVEGFKSYLAKDNLYAPQGGETCNNAASSDPYWNAEPQVQCPNALAELARLHYSALNTEFEPGVIARWKSGGCFDQIRRQLGYRYRLTEATVPVTAAPGGALTLRFTIQNDGWASVYNWRPTQLVLRNSASNQLYRVNVPTDPRFWLPGSAGQPVSVTAGLPSALPAGSYDVLLNFPDAYGQIAWNPAYSLRLANAGTWEAATGFNNLGRRVTVQAGGGPAYTGSVWFQAD